MIRKSSIHLKRFLRRYCRMYSLSSENNINAKEEISKIRNIGILAHIDAGKTTTTERMLFYSGKIRMMGEVHDGNTVTDYMEQERNRGITITSAAVTFHWLKHRLNLIDTPGHIDFTMEVEQALNVTDGAIIVLDSSAGVEAQTLTVWRQADRYRIPRIVYANKMDRNDADLRLCSSTLISKLGACPLTLQIPLRENSKLVGILDIITKERCLWKGDRGQTLTKVPVVESDGLLWEELMTARSDLADRLTEFDDTLAETVISLDSLDNLDDKHLVDAVRRVTLSQKAIPLICGSSYKNIGVQLLMNSIVNYLPSPLECSYHSLLASCFKNELSSKAFKIVHDKQKGPITFLRIYSGSLTKGQKIYNVREKKSEQINKLMVALADDYEEVKVLGAGNVAAVTGLKNVITGDLISSSNSAMASAKKYLMSEQKVTDEEAENRLGVGVNVPDPVFFCSIEPASLKFQVPLESALKELQTEDPSLRVSFDSETGQTVLGGMGELHLEIIKQRIESEYKVEMDLGPLQIAYKEQLVSPIKHTYELKHKIGSSNHWAKLVLSANISSNDGNKSEFITLDKHPDNVANVMNISPRRLLLIRQGLQSGLLHGPLIGSPVINVNFTIHWLEVGRNTSESMLIAAASQCVREILELSGTVLFEPIMSLEVITDESSFSPVLSDLTMRRAAIENVGIRGNNKTVSALVPLSELLGFSKNLRIITSGVGSFAMEFHEYQQASQLEQSKIIQQLTGIN